MLKVVNINKSFKYGKNNREIVLKNINLNFKTKELVFITGESGSGKSTLLNIIGGLLLPDSGSIIVDDKDITKYNDNLISKFRNGILGFIFQNYNLIEHMSVMDNLKICQSKRDIEKINILLKQLNIYDKRNKEVCKLSGGEKERVAIARAIINDPEIILCDEPTGALDSKNSRMVMEILKKISEQKLVIVVTHDLNLAREYGDRIIEIKDGEIVNGESEVETLGDNFKDKKLGKIKLREIFKLAIKNLWLNKKRTFLISLACLIGIIAIMLVINLSSGFKREITSLEDDLIMNMPIIIRNGEYLLDSKTTDNDGKIIVRDNDVHTNKITGDFLEYIKNSSNYKYMVREYDISMPLVSDKYKLIDRKDMKIVPKNEYISDNYILVSGKYPDSVNEIVIEVSQNEEISKSLGESLLIDKSINYKDIIDRKIKVILNNEYFIKKGDYYYFNSDYEGMYNDSKLELKIVGIVKEKEAVENGGYILYSQELIDMVISKNRDSEIVREQIESNEVIGPFNFDRDKVLGYLGYNPLPKQILIYVDSIKNKEIFTNYLDKYKDKFIYEDNLEDMMMVVRDFINIVVIVLVMFSLISFMVSGIMISIITNTRVIERVKEIGILRSMGATKRNIKSLFNIENGLIAVYSSVMAYIIVFLLKGPINQIISSYLDVSNMFEIGINSYLVIVILNIILVIVSGMIPSNKASKLEIVECLRR